MRRAMRFFGVFVVFLFFVSPIQAGIVGDIDGDGAISLSEAIYALQVATGSYNALSPSCLLEGKGDWTEDTDYMKCDVVQSGGSYFAANSGHLSTQDNKPPNEEFWTLLTLTPFPPGKGLTIKDAEGNVTHTLAADGTGSHAHTQVFLNGIVIGVKPPDKSEGRAKEFSPPPTWRKELKMIPNGQVGFMEDYYDPNNVLRYQRSEWLEVHDSYLSEKFFDSNGNSIKYIVYGPEGKTIYDKDGNKTFERHTNGDSTQSGTQTITKEGQGAVTTSPTGVTGSNAAGQTTVSIDTATGNVTSSGAVNAGGLNISGSGTGSFQATLDHFLGSDSSGTETFRVDNTAGNVAAKGNISAQSAEFGSSDSGTVYMNPSGFELSDPNGYTNVMVSPGGGIWANGTITTTKEVQADSVASKDSYVTDTQYTKFLETEGVHNSGDTAIDGNLNVTGDLQVNGAKNAAQDTRSYGRLLMYSDESAEVYFFDRGRAVLKNGRVTIQLDPRFLELSTFDHDRNPLLIQITPLGDCKGMFLAEYSDTGFTIRELMGGTSDTAFMWEAAAKRKGFEDRRMEPVDPAR